MPWWSPRCCTTSATCSRWPSARGPATAPPTSATRPAGSAWLAGLFPPAVTAPIALHVRAKRYLCAVDPSYLAVLSPGSVASLERQGGPLSADEVAAFEANPGWEDAVALRRWDDQAKVPDLPVPPPVPTAPSSRPSHLARPPQLVVVRGSTLGTGRGCRQPATCVRSGFGGRPQVAGVRVRGGGRGWADGVGVSSRSRGGRRSARARWLRALTPRWTPGDPAARSASCIVSMSARPQPVALGLREQVDVQVRRVRRRRRRRRPVPVVEHRDRAARRGRCHRSRSGAALAAPATSRPRSGRRTHACRGHRGSSRWRCRLRRRPRRRAPARARRRAPRRARRTAAARRRARWRPRPRLRCGGRSRTAGRGRSPGRDGRARGRSTRPRSTRRPQGQRPVQVGGRFSRKAEMPSWASSVAAFSVMTLPASS